MCNHIKNGDRERLSGLLLPHLSKRGVTTLGGPDLVLVVKSLQERAQTLEEMAERAVFETVAEKLAMTSAADAAGFDGLFKDICTEKGWKMPQVGQPVRIVLSGGTQAPGVGEIIQILGSAEAIRRIHNAVGFLASK